MGNVRFINPGSIGKIFTDGIDVTGGQILAPDGTAAAPGIAFGSDPDTGTFSLNPGFYSITINGVESHRFQDGLYSILGNGGSIRIGQTFDVQLHRDAANTLALRNLANAQEFRVYASDDGTQTDTSYLRISSQVEVGWNEITSFNTGIGAVRHLRIGTRGSGGVVRFISGGTDRWQIAGGGNFSSVFDNTVDIGNDAVQRPRTMYLATSLEIQNAVTTVHTLKMNKVTSAVTAPGVGTISMRVEAGTNAGSLKIVAYSGTGTTGVTIVDNVGVGN